MSKYYDTLVLSGGSIKSLSTLGAIQYCIDVHLIDKINTYIGTSSGSIIAYFLAIGYSPTEILAYVCTNNLFKDVFINILNMVNGEGAINFTKEIQEPLEQLTIEKIGKLMTFKEIHDHFKKKIVMTTYNYTLQQVEYLSYETTPEMPCIVGLRMSCCLPLIFKPYKYMDSYYIDGGIYDNFPITYSDSKRQLGIVVNFKNDTSVSANDTLNYIYNIISIVLEQQTNDKLKLVKDIDVISIKNDIHILNFNLSVLQKMELFSVGYTTAKEYYEQR